MKFCLSYILVLSICFLTSCSKSSTATTPTSPGFIEDILVSDADAKLGDTEFDPYGKRMSFQTINDNTLWVCDINPTTGKLVVGSGKQTQIDNGIVPLTASFNSGEWAFSQQGTAIVYNKLVGSTYYCAIATVSGTAWTPTTITSTPNRFNPRATKNPSDAVGAFQCVTQPGSGTTKFKYLNSLATELSISNFSDAHWADDEQLLTGILTNNQVGFYNPATMATPVQVTNTPENTYTRPYMWRAPEFGNARMFFTKANGSKIEVYKETTPGINNYTLYTQFNCPSTVYPNIGSPEPVVFKGKSYITFMAAESPLETSGKPAEIWIANVDAVNPVFLQVSDASTRVRTDPEPYIDIANNQLYIYYTEVDDSVVPDFAIDPTTILRLRRCKTGL